MFAYDRTSKWLIQHHGDSILRLGGLAGPFTWRPLQAEVVQPRQLPDGVLEVRFPGQSEPDLFLLEIATYPDQRLVEQVLRGQLLVYLDRGQLPEVLVLVLHPKGNLQAAGSVALNSLRGWTQWQARWRVQELWGVPAADLFAANDVGLIPWIPLTNFGEPPETVLQQCRERIDRQATAEERPNLLAVTQVLAGLRYNDPRLMQILGGTKAMIESPVLNELLAQRDREAKQQALLLFLGERFGPLPEELAAEIRTVGDEARLDNLIKFAARCPDLDAFRAGLRS